MSRVFQSNQTYCFSLKQLKHWFWIFFTGFTESTVRLAWKDLMNLSSNFIQRPDLAWLEHRSGLAGVKFLRKYCYLLHKTCIESISITSCEDDQYLNNSLLNRYFNKTQENCILNLLNSIPSALLSERFVKKIHFRKENKKYGLKEAYF